MSPCPGKCFAHAATPAPCRPRTKAATCRATSSPSAPNERMPMTGFSRVRVHVRDRREVDVHADRATARPPSPPRPAPSARRRRPRREPRCRGTSFRSRLEPRHVAAFLVDRDEHVVALGPQRRGQRRELIPALDVPREEDDAAETSFEPAPHPVGAPRPLEAREDAGRREPLERRVSGAPPGRPVESDLIP